MLTVLCFVTSILFVVSDSYVFCQLTVVMAKTVLVVLMAAKGKLVTRHCTNTVSVVKCYSACTCASIMFLKYL